MCNYAIAICFAYQIVLLKAPMDVVEDVDAAVVVTATTTTVTTATTIIIMTTATTVDVTVDAIKPFQSIAAMYLI